MTCFLEFPKLQISAASYQNQNHLLVKTGFITLNPVCFSRIYCLPMEFNSSSPNTIRVVSTFASPFEGSPDQNDSSNSSSSRKPLSLWPGMYHSPVTNALWETRSKVFERLLDPPLDAPPQSELLKKTPAESRTSILYNFSTDYILREQYRDPWNEVRIGKLLEDLDALAGTISVKHCSDVDSMTRPLYLVTASVDKMVLKKPISVDTDLKMTGKAAPVNRLCPEAEAEKLLYEAAEARNNIRKRKRGEDKREIENGGVNRLEELLAEGRIFCDMPALADRDTILLRDTRLENSLICQPQQRNIHGRIFGGFLMLRAFELAFSTAYAFAGLMPSFLEVDHVNFLRPVDVGDFLRFKSCVLYTEHENTDQPLINVEVVAHVTRPEQRSSEVSNRFYFTFTVRTEAKATNSQFRIRKVVPATEEEARRVLERMDADHLQSIKYTCK
ncbi:acyl-coenzyme A thioesterase 2, chloroplastic isoform X2 [Nicotiana tomentosiformis]|uniref:acyl-coenzyme A thioesterase 2, chloroplastic isoform X2 n=1 Tax=Nicotiana tomentosiformis TaxID=4098 RepID=UPI00051BC26D